MWEAFSERRQTNELVLLVADRRSPPTLMIKEAYLVQKGLELGGIRFIHESLRVRPEEDNHTDLEEVRCNHG